MYVFIFTSVQLNWSCAISCTPHTYINHVAIFILTCIYLKLSCTVLSFLRLDSSITRAIYLSYFKLSSIFGDLSPPLDLSFFCYLSCCVMWISLVCLILSCLVLFCRATLCGKLYFFLLCHDHFCSQSEGDCWPEGLYIFFPYLNNHQDLINIIGRSFILKFGTGCKLARMTWRKLAVFLLCVSRFLLLLLCVSLCSLNGNVCGKLLGFKCRTFVVLERFISAQWGFKHRVTLA